MRIEKECSQYSVSYTHLDVYKRQLMKYPNMEIIDVEYGNFDRVTAQKAMENALIKAANRGQTIDCLLYTSRCV